ncbi:MAG: response regulator transcription factor [Anaerolineae bacterium]|nr:response regulator transcription factor [Anaerolineae bacterium]
MEQSITIILADDHTVLRAGLRLLLDTQPDMQVIGEASDGLEVIRLAEKLTPNLIILDLTMAGLGGMEALPLLRKAAPAARILILTMHDDESYLRQTLRDGASGYVLKKAADNELLSAIRAVMRGEVYVHPAMTKALLNDIISLISDNNEYPWDTLSERERDVLIKVARGLTSAKIAEQLNLSQKTVETYRARGMEKLGLRSRAALVQFVLAHNLFSEA